MPLPVAMRIKIVYPINYVNNRREHNFRINTIFTYNISTKSEVSNFNICYSWVLHLKLESHSQTLKQRNSDQAFVNTRGFCFKIYNYIHENDLIYTYLEYVFEISLVQTKQRNSKIKGSMWYNIRKLEWKLWFSGFQIPFTRESNNA